MSFEADGRRNDPAGNKPVSLPRVLVVGCSFTQGYGVADDQTFSHFVNQSLPSAELLNFGTGAYGSYQSRLRVNHYFKAAHPKTPLVIYGLFYSHHLRDLAPMPWIAQPDDEGRQLHGAAEHPHAVGRNHRKPRRPDRAVAAGKPDGQRRVAAPRGDETGEPRDDRRW